MSQPPPASTDGSSSTSRRNARNARRRGEDHRVDAGDGPLDQSWKCSTTSVPPPGRLADLEAVGLVRHEAQAEAEAGAVGARRQADAVVVDVHDEAVAARRARRRGHRRRSRRRAVAVGVQDGVRRGLAHREVDLQQDVVVGAEVARDVGDGAADGRDLDARAGY